MDMKVDSLFGGREGRARSLFGPMAVGTGGSKPARGWLSALQKRYSESKWFCWTVIVPTACVAIYCYAFAANQYVSETQFIVKGPQSTSSSLLGILSGSGLQQSAPEETSGVAAFLDSHDAVDDLKKRFDLVGMLGRSGADFLNWVGPNPSEESLLKIYRKHVNVSSNAGNGLVTLQVRAYRPADAELIAHDLLNESEQVVNRFSDRAEEDAVRSANREVDEAETRLEAINGQLARFRNSRQALDPTRSSANTMQEAAALDTQAQEAKADLARSQYKPGSPAYQALQAQIESYQRAIDEKQHGLVGADNSVANELGDYQKLSLQQEAASKDYGSAISALEAARLDAQRQHLYLVPVVQPNLPERSLYPNRGLTILTVFVSLCVAYGIGWLIIAGVKEHAA